MRSVVGIACAHTGLLQSTEPASQIGEETANRNIRFCSRTGTLQNGKRLDQRWPG